MTVSLLHRACQPSIPIALADADEYLSVALVFFAVDWDRESEGATFYATESPSTDEDRR